MNLHQTLVKTAEKEPKNRTKTKLITAIVLSLVLLGGVWLTLQIRTVHRSGHVSSAEDDLHLIAAAEVTYHTSRSQYGTLAQLQQMEGHRFSQSESEGYHLQIRLIAGGKYDAVALPGPPFPFWLPAQWEREYGDPVCYLDTNGKEHRFPYGTPIPPEGFKGKLPPEWKW